MSKEQVMDYVMNSPANTNPNVLSGMLDSIADAGGGGTLLFVVNGTPNIADLTVTTDKTYEEIRAAYDSGALVIMKCDYYGFVKNMMLTQVTPNALMFGCDYYDDSVNNKTGFMVVTLKNDGTSAYKIWNQ